MNQIGILLVLCILIALFVLGIFYMLRYQKGYSMAKHYLVPVCCRGIYALCFAEGYVILTESYQQAQGVCADLHLNMNPYWSQIIHTFPSEYMALSCYREIEQYIGASVASFVSFMPDGKSVRFQGYISTLRN